ncbi:MAG: RNase adapter RapZ [Acidobacteriota bacterium]|jgi:RNase adapter protein RapZ
MTESTEGEVVRKQVVIITGMSGSGKHTAFKAFEDLGFFCVDNLPTALVPRLIDVTIASGGKIDKLAVVVDARLGERVEDFRRLFRRLRRSPFESQVIFFDAPDRVLAERYSETRRVHPLARSASLLEGFQAERAALSEVRAMADAVVDTADLSVHDLRRLIYERFRSPGAARPFNLSLVSFGFKRGLPYNSDLVFDVRFLPNPYFIPALKEKTGNDPEVVQYLEQFEESAEIISRIASMLEYLLPKYAREGKSYCTVGIGCTGGQHRSVVIANGLAARLSAGGFEVNLVHRDLHLE